MILGLAVVSIGAKNTAATIIYANPMGSDNNNGTTPIDPVRTILRAMQLAKAAGLTGVPAVMINGKYMTSASLAGSHDGMIRAIEETVEIEHKAAGS